MICSWCLNNLSKIFTISFRSHGKKITFLKGFALRPFWEVQKKCSLGPNFQIQISLPPRVVIKWYLHHIYYLNRSLKKHFFWHYTRPLSIYPHFFEISRFFKNNIPTSCSRSCRNFCRILKIGRSATSSDICLIAPHVSFM